MSSSGLPLEVSNAATDDVSVVTFATTGALLFPGSTATTETSVSCEPDGSDATMTMTMTNGTIQPAIYIE
jgi:hypothetical protein